MIGTMRRLGRLFHPQSAKSVVLALDHGASEGLIPGLTEIPLLIEGSKHLPVQGVVLNKGLARASVGSLSLDKNVFIQLSAGTKHGLPTYNQSIVCSVNEALRLGADAVSVHVNIGNDLEDRMLQDFGMVTDEAHAVGLPVMAVIYARGGQIVNELDPALITHCIRLGGELGADVVCVPYSGDQRSFALGVATCPVPVLVAGGPYQPNWKSAKKMLAEAMEAGASGVVLGRAVFQPREPLRALAEVCQLVHGSTEGVEVRIEDSSRPAPEDDGAGAEAEGSGGRNAPSRAQAAQERGEVGEEKGVDQVREIQPQAQEEVVGRIAYRPNPHKGFGVLN